jgi:ABC-type uncharacterized transport system permease subunit
MRGRRDWLGSVVGLLIFLGGIALLLFTFKLAFERFTAPPAQTLGIQVGKAVDLNRAGTNFAGLLLQVLWLVVMAIVGGLISNRGIKLYSDSLIIIAKKKSGGKKTVEVASAEA